MVALVYVVLASLGIRWGLPSEERTALYDADAEQVIGRSADRLFFTGPLQSYQVDECSALMPLARMKPRSLRFDPGWFHWGSFHLYTIGAALAAAHLLGFVTLAADKAFYLTRPDQLASIYLVARFVSWLLGLGCVLLFMALLGRVVRQPVVHVALGLMLVLSPLFLLYAHSATPDIALVFWILATALLAGVGRQKKPRWWLLYAAFATSGLAASVKFNGVLVLILPIYAAVEGRQVKILARGLLFAGLSFLAGTPYAVFNFHTFLQDLVWQWRHVQAGHGDAFLGTSHSLVYHILESLPSGIGPWTTVLFLISLPIALYRWRAHRLGSLLLLLLVFWVQLARSPLKFSRYMLPLIPMHLLVLGYGVQWAWNSRRKGVFLALGLAMCLTSQVVLTAEHVGTLTQDDVRNRAGMWLKRRGDSGDTVFFPGAPYFASPPISSKKFNIVVSTLTQDTLAAVSPDWIVLTDYDTEPWQRAPELRRAQAQAAGLLFSGGELTQGVCYEKHEFATAPHPPLWASGGVTLLPHDLRYHCPTIWIFEKHACRDDGSDHPA